MFVAVTDKDKKLYTHTSLLDEDKADKIKTVHDRVSYFTTGATFFTFYFEMEAVNRIKPLAKLVLWQRALIVAVPTLLARFLTPTIYWKAYGNTELKKLINGAPVYDNVVEVPELDKMFFFLDDDNNYEPSIYHHGVTRIQKPKKFYTYLP